MKILYLEPNRDAQTQREVRSHKYGGDVCHERKKVELLKKKDSRIGKRSSALLFGAQNHTSGYVSCRGSSGRGVAISVVQRGWEVER